MSKRNTKPLIALDADGVLLDYSLAYARAWERAFGVFPKEINPNGLTPLERWDVEHLQGIDLEYFKSFFDEDFWSTIPAMPEAIEACELLVANGYELVCVTAMESKWRQARQRNLKALRYPIDVVIATGKAVENHLSPKARTINTLKPQAFVDDHIPYFVGIDLNIHRALVIGQHRASISESVRTSSISSTHSCLMDFCQYWLLRNS